MQTNIKIILAIIAVITLTACTKSYTNRELRDIFDAKGLETSEREQGVVVFFPGVFFEFVQANLTPAAQLKVSDIASVM